MTLITGQFLDSGRQPIASGKLRVQLNAPLTDEAATPDAYALTIPRDFAITAGALETCNLQESETAQVSYTFTVLQAFTDYDYYLAGTGDFYGTNSDRPTHLHTDSKYYSGVSHTPESVQLERVARTRLETAGAAFQAIVPNVASVEFTQIARIGFATDRLPQNARQVAQALRQDPQFINSLIDLLVARPYSPTQLYQRGNVVETGGSSYQCLIDNTIGVAPSDDGVTWKLFAAKGAPGGTGGQDTAYNAATWDGQTWAPTANVIRDKFELMASIAQLATYAPLASPALTGVPTAPTPAFGVSNTQVATTAFVNSNYANLISPGFTGTPTCPTPSLFSYSDQLATTKWVVDYSTQKGLLLIASYVGTTALTLNTFNQVNWDNENYDPLNLHNAGVFTPTDSAWYEIHLTARVVFVGGTNQFLSCGLYQSTTQVYLFGNAIANSALIAHGGFTAPVFLTGGTPYNIRFNPNVTSGTSASIPAQGTPIQNRVAIFRST